MGSSSLEIEFWRYLTNDAICLKQKIPDVALFKNKCKLEAWYYSTKKGDLLKKKTDSVTVEAFQQRVLQVAEERLAKSGKPVGSATPVAILRKTAAIAGSSDKEGCPVAIVLTAGELGQVVDKVGGTQLFWKDRNCRA